MHDNAEPEEALLSDTGAEGRAAGRDPLDAVLAVEQPRREAEAAADTAGTETARNEKPPGAEAAAESGDDGYGEFEWPDGYVADPEALARFVPLARRLGLPKEGAQELARLYAELDRQRQDNQARFIAKNNAEWLREIHAHPEFGGGNLQRTGEAVASMLRRYGTPLLTAQIRQMNVQNWPEMFYFLARVSQAVSEDCSPSGGGDRPAKSTAELLFPGLK
ncbi:MAG: hypothetical protein LUE17_01475 [Planctomycetaceae bacterium]|nr:hypothetical protein [Planctomycetaceae bacterium]